MQIPALRRLRRSFPEAHITLCTRKWTRGIFDDADFIDSILEILPDESFLSQVRKWRRERFDLAVLFTNSFETALIARLGKSGKQFGYANEGRSILLSNSIAKPVWKNEKHEIHYYLNLVAEIESSFGIDAPQSDPEFGLTVNPDRLAAARRILDDSGIPETSRVIAFCPGSTNSRAKRWPTEYYAKLNDLLAADNTHTVVLLGDASELDVSLEVVEKSTIKPVVLTGKTSLAEAVSLLSICSLLVSNDTGPAHISAALGTKTVVIFGPTNPKTTHPIGAKILREPVDCAPCMLRDCPIDHRCMTRITPERVLAAVNSELDKI